VASTPAPHDKPDPKRWHLADPIVVGGDTWALHSNWGRGTRGFFGALLALALEGFAVYAENEIPSPSPDSVALVGDSRK
jgi:hypothetical protein